MSKSTPEYKRNHVKVRRERGPAGLLSCVDCGGPANHWSLIHDGNPADVHAYEPRCHSCHLRYDGPRGIVRRYGGEACTNGHAFTEENTGYRNGHRQCRRCHADAQARYAARKNV